MSVLKLGLKRIENVVLMCVIEQDTSVIKRSTFRYTSDNGITFCSLSKPDICVDDEEPFVFLRGSSIGCDTDVSQETFSTDDDAKRFVNRLRAAVAELNKKYAPVEVPAKAPVLEFDVVE